MNETLSVINEHITDLSTPRQSLAPPQPSADDTESEYSSHLDHGSYIAGPETDSEDNGRLTEAEVKTWTAKETAEYLRGLGVDSKHCDIFEEQEITGDVLLDMDQSFIHMKEFDFGLMGRRLKTWHKIRDFQNQVRDGRDSRKSSLRPTNGSSEDIGRSAVRTTALLPRIPSLIEEPGLSLRSSQNPQPYVHLHSTSPTIEQPMSPSSFARPQRGDGTPPSPWRASMATDSPTRPTASSTHETSRSRRHSSIEYAKSGIQETLAAHKKNPSFDRDWSMSNATTAHTSGSTPSLRLNVSNKPPSIDLMTDTGNEGEDSTIDIDRGYFSGNEVDNRKARNLLKKRGGTESASHSRQSSAMDGSSKANLGMKRHSRLSSVDSIRERTLSAMSPASKAYHSSSYKGRFRSASARNLTPIKSPVAPSPTVTNLEDDFSAFSSPKPVSGSASPSTAESSLWTSSAKARKLLGLRAASEAVTGTEKDAAASSSNLTSDTLKESPIASPSGSQTPSITSRSFDMENTDTSSKGTIEQLGPLLHTKAPVRTNPKTKRQTSAYTKGLMQISPAEARKISNHSGWMKKRSSGIVAQWKPRLFVLRGRRLSYYYSENDTEEKGIIDISGHRVLNATPDPIVSLSSVMSGISTPSLKSGGSSAETSPNVSRNVGGGAPFCFKLVPPKAGSSRAVQFTKPTVHIFQVDNIVEGRKWMAEILKATIDHDFSSFETTNRQKTISLAKARARKERPPALKGTEEITGIEEIAEVPEVAELAEQPTPYQEKGELESGLNISGLEFNESNIDLQLGMGSPMLEKVQSSSAQETQAAEEKSKT
jgi:hypothetical protein